MGLELRPIVLLFALLSTLGMSPTLAVELEDTGFPPPTHQVLLSYQFVSRLGSPCRYRADCNA